MPRRARERPRRPTALRAPASHVPQGTCPARSPPSPSRTTRDPGPALTARAETRPVRASPTRSSAAARIAGDGSLSRSITASNARDVTGGADGCDDFERHRAVDGLPQQVQERLDGRRPADLAKRADGGDAHLHVSLGIEGRGLGERHGGPILQRAETSERESGGVDAWRAGEHQQSGRGSRIANPLQRVRDGPPTRHRLTFRRQGHLAPAARSRAAARGQTERAGRFRPPAP